MQQKQGYKIMDYVKDWSLNVSATLVIAVIFSLLTPKGNMGKYLKIIIALFITLSLLLPITEFDFDEINFSGVSDLFGEESTNDDTYKKLITAQVDNVLKESNINSADISCKLKISEDNEIEIKEITVSITDEYNADEVKNMIYDNLGFVAQVKYIGQ